MASCALGHCSHGSLSPPSHPSTYVPIRLPLVFTAACQPEAPSTYPPQVLSHRALDRHLLPGWSLCPGPGLLLLLTREDTETWGERTAIRQPAAVEESPDPEPVFVTLCYTATLMYSSFLSLNHEVSFLNECDSLLI